MMGNRPFFQVWDLLGRGAMLDIGPLRLVVHTGRYGVGWRFHGGRNQWGDRTLWWEASLGRLEIRWMVHWDEDW